MRIFLRGEHALMRCDQCSMSFVSPHPDDKDRVDFYQADDYFNDIYKESPLPRIMRQQWESSRLALADRWKHPGSRLLEVGCGRGTFLARAVQKGWDSIGVEIGDAASKAAAEVSRTTVHSGTIFSAGLEDDSFDVVCAWDVIEHVPDPGAFLEECRRVLMPGGGLLLSCPNVDTWPPKVFKSKWWTLKPDEHLWHFQPETLRLALVDAEFKPLKVLTSALGRENLFRFDSMVAVAKAPNSPGQG